MDTEALIDEVIDDGVKNQSESESGYLPEKEESTADILQRQLDELDRRVEKYFDSFDDLEEMCRQTKADVKRFEMKAQAEREIARKDAEIQAKLFSELQEIKHKMKRMEIKEDETPPEEKTPDAATRNALRYTTGARVCRFIKIGCVMVLDAVAAYGLFKITQPYLF